MPAKRTYSDEDRATVLNFLEVNKGNVKRTARETGVAEQTVRDWKKAWEKEGVPAATQDALPAVKSEFVANATRIRNMMLDNLEARVLNDDLNGRDLIVGIGVLTDKLRISSGEATSRTENISLPPTADQIGASIEAYLAKTLRDGSDRDVEIEDAEWQEQSPQGELLSPASPTEQGE